jgi:hypothetical protein
MARVSPEPNSGCWLWCSTVSPRGYGRYPMDGRNWFAHRAAWRLFRGPIPDGLFLCHKCDVPGCVNPDHLFLGTARDNALDAVAKRRHTFGVKSVLSKLTDAEVADILAIGRTMPVRKIAALYGINNASVCRIINGKQWQHIPGERAPKPHPDPACQTCGTRGCVNPDHLTPVDSRDTSGETAGTHKLTERQIIQIRELLPTTPVKRLARSYGVSPKMIRLIRDRKNWSHI